MGAGEQVFSLGLPLTDERLSIMIENHDMIIGGKSVSAVF